jgi:hypothetical protein
MLDSIKNENKLKKKITFSLDENLINNLKEVSKKAKVKQNKIVEYAIKEALKQLKKELEGG